MNNSNDEIALKTPIIVGPTAVGKTTLSLILARQLGNAEIVSADSRQVYKLMDIGTAKPSARELNSAPHHFIDIIYPDQHYSAGRYAKDARDRIRGLFAAGKIPIVVGGSGLYLRALVDGLFNRQVSDPQIKRRLKAEIDQIGVKPLYDQLRRIDPLSAQKIHPNDGHRIVRALEVFEITGMPISTFQEQQTEAAEFDPCFIGIERHRNHLYQLIEKRVDQMIANGFVHEVEMLQARGYHADLNSMQTVGYREVFAFLQGKIDREQMIRLIKQHTRNYAKRQLTWFRRDARIRWYNLDQYPDIDRLIDEILRQLPL